ARVVRRHRRTSGVASGRLAVGSALMLSYLFAAEPLSPSARDRVLAQTKCEFVFTRILRNPHIFVLTGKKISSRYHTLRFNTLEVGRECHNLPRGMKPRCRNRPTKSR